MIIAEVNGTKKEIDYLCRLYAMTQPTRPKQNFLYNVRWK